MDSTQIAQAAYVNAQSTCAMIEAMGMVEENRHDQNVGNPHTYRKDDFDKLITKYGIHHNATVTALFRA